MLSMYPTATWIGPLISHSPGLTSWRLGELFEGEGI